MHGSSILDYSQPPGRNLLNDAVVEQDHAIGDIFLQTVSCKDAFATFRRDDRRDPPTFQPPKEPPEFGAKDQFVRQCGEQGFDRIEHDSFCLDVIDGMTKPEEESFQIVLAGFLDLTLFRSHEIQHQETSLDEIRQVEPERGDVLHQFLFVLFKRHEHAWLCEFGRTSHEEFHAEERFPATSPAGDERRTPAWQTATGDFVEAGNTSWCLRETREFAFTAETFRRKHIS